jgi:hypothetical protein
VIRALLAALGGVISGWGMWLALNLVLDAVIGTTCSTTCLLLPGVGCRLSTAPCPLSPFHLAADATAALTGLLVCAGAARYLYLGRS